MICPIAKGFHGSQSISFPKSEAPTTTNPMTAALQAARPTYAYRRTRPFSNAEYKFKVALADYATQALLPKLRSRTSRAPDANQYTGISVRVADDVVYLEAIITNATEWGGFGFDFARFIPVKGGLYNLSLRRGEDWRRAEESTVAAASNYFINTAISPRAVDWIQITRGKTFEECVECLMRNLDFATH
jgi:hypothetical protein